MSRETRELDEAAAVCRRLLTTTTTLVFATSRADGLPGLGSSPFVRDANGVLYVLLSKLAAHTRELLKLERTTVLILEPDARVQQPFARKRLQLLCDVRVVAADDAAYQIHIDALTQRFGNVIGVLRSLPDFQLIGFQPRSGRYVGGFGQAFDMLGGDPTQLRRVAPP